MRRPGTAGPRFWLAAVVCLAVGVPAARAQGGGQSDSAHKSTTGLARTLPAYRNRIVGVFDAQTYQPMEGAEVSDVLSGMKSLTTMTGTVSRFFLPQGGSIVRVRKPGYEPQTFLVTTVPEDTLPITLVLEKMPELPTIVSTATSPRYVSARLRGFEERRKEGFGYFVPEAELRKNDDMQLTYLRSTYPAS